MENFNALEERDAYKASENLSFALHAYLLISLLGALALVVVGAIPSCPFWEPTCQNKTDYGNLWLIGVAIVGVVTTLVVYYFGQTVAAKVRLEVVRSLESDE